MDSGRPVPLFGHDKMTTLVPARLALRTGAAVIPVFALPLPGGRFKMIYEHPVEPPPAGNLTPEEQMALFEKELKENDWGHQPC